MTLASLEHRPSGALAALAAGAVLDDRFRLVAPIGRGGFGHVWRADELLPNGTAIRQIALKILSPESDLGTWGEEAKLLASFSHPALVTILAAGVVHVADGGERRPAPFVAMELLDGETLAQRLARLGPLPWRCVLAWAREVAAALDVIHGRGVVHLDLKPSNVFLGAGGVVKVLDFGIARRAGAPAPVCPAPADAAMGTAEFLLERGVDAAPPGSAGKRPATSSPVVGTPGFMAPEVIEDRPATPAADAYALAACIVQLATGWLPHDVPAPPAHGASDAARKAWWAEVRHATATGALRDLEAGPRPLPRGVAAMCRKLLSLEPEARGVASGALREAIDEAWSRPHGVPDPPYRGLAALGPDAEGLLFGRDEDVTRLDREVAERTVVVLQGSSGSGKSSLAMAGVVPALAKRDAPKGLGWEPVLVRPGDDPDAALERALVALDPQLAGVGAGAIVAWCDARSAGLAIVVDQLEELVTVAAAARRDRLVELLCDVAARPPSDPVRVVATLREDFTSQLLALAPRDREGAPLAAALRDALRFVGPPPPSSVQGIVAGPARLAGVAVEGAADVAADVQAELRAGDGRLPLVAVALATWWHARDGGALTAKSWRKLGGVKAILSDTADGVFDGLDEAARAEARAALIQLATDDRARRRVRAADLRVSARDPAALDRAVDAFAAAGLFARGADGGVEVVHEALFTAWRRLDEWLAAAHASRRVARALREGARAWHELGRVEGRLPDGGETALASVALGEGAFAGDDEELVRAWLEAAGQRARGRRVRGAIIAAAVLAALAAGLGAWAVTLSEAQARADHAKEESDAAAARAKANEAAAAAAKRDADAAKAEADASRHERERAADLAIKQQRAFDESLRAAESELERTRVRCTVVQNAPRIKSGGCPPGDPLCTNSASSANAGNGANAGSLPVVPRPPSASSGSF